MKQGNFLSVMVIICAMFSLAASCKKSNNGTSSGALPPATQTGANTFGCIVNGQIFLPKTNSFNGRAPYQCNYIYTNGGYYFHVDGSNKASSDYISDVSLNTTLLSIQEGQTYKLEDNQSGKANGSYDIVLRDSYTTTSGVNGQLKITKLDQTKQIVSGTFFFNAINSKGDTIRVTDGRFDMKYTQ